MFAHHVHAHDICQHVVDTQRNILLVFSSTTSWVRSKRNTLLVVGINIDACDRLGEQKKSVVNERNECVENRCILVSFCQEIARQKSA